MLSKPRILAVDDNPRNLSILRRAIGEEFNFTAAASGEEALEWASRNRPDVILLDIMMPGLDGYETCRRLKARPDLSSVKILLVSAKSMTADRLEGYAAGADDFVVKPFEPAELLAKVRVYARLKSVEEVDRLKSNLLTLLSHETRTPLTLIASPVSLLLDRADLSEQQRELLRMVETGARRLCVLLDKVAFLSQLRLREIAFRMADADLGAIAREAADRARARSAEADVRVTVEVAGSAPIRGDAEHVGGVLDALLDNAIRFSRGGGTVRVQVGGSDTHAVLIVSDSGPGIDPEVAPRIFEEFAATDIDHHKSGHGLSLATARLIVEQHGGTLRLVPAPGSAGATFRIEIPLVSLPAPTVKS
jgi:two-component system sensor histidine kinase/response regulator